MGIDDLKDDGMKNLKLFQFTKYFQKLHKDTNYLFFHKIIEDYKDKYTSGDNYTFYFWGHSLDISDKDYILEVFESLELRKENKIKIFYHDISAKASQLRNLLSVIQDKNIIEALMKSKRLQFIESTPDNLFKELA